MSVESDEELARRLQTEFDEEYHQFQRDSDKKEYEISDADKTMSEDELNEIREKMEKRKIQNKNSISKPLHEISDSDSDEIQPLVKPPTQKHRSKKPNTKSQPVLHEISDSDDEPPSNKPKSSTSKPETDDTDDRPLCQFGAECYRKNPLHRKMYRHEETEEIEKKRAKIDELSSSRDSTCDSNPFNFYLTKVSGISNQFNTKGAIDIKDILSEKMGNLVESVQFNYMHDIEWLINQYPTQFRSKPLLLVHGEQRESKKALTKEASQFPNVTLCQAKLEILYGTHHTKMMILLYDNGMRIVIHTANLIRGDWHQKTQGVWLSPVFPPLPENTSPTDGESSTNFKKDFLEYLSAYNASELNIWCDRIKQHDLSAAKVFLIGSTPGRHTGNRLASFGHLKLRRILKEHGPKSTVITPDWNVIGQFSSIGSLGASADLWLNKELLVSLSVTKSSNSRQLPKLDLIFPSVENVRLSLEGYPAGSCLPYSYDVAKKQPWLHKLFHLWKSENRGRTHASPHIKTYTRVSPSYDSIAWFLVTSANLSKAAWGSMEKNGTQFMIRSYELGVLFLPQYVNGNDIFTLGRNSSKDFPLPYDVPLLPYEKDDEPWIWNISHINLPDRHGNKWCR